MESLLVRIIAIFAIGQLGSTLTVGEPCVSIGCLNNIQSASRKIARIDWRPISVFPEEAKRFESSTSGFHGKKRRLPKAAHLVSSY